MTWSCLAECFDISKPMFASVVIWTAKRCDFFVRVLRPSCWFCIYFGPTIKLSFNQDSSIKQPILGPGQNYERRLYPRSTKIRIMYKSEIINQGFVLRSPSSNLFARARHDAPRLRRAGWSRMQPQSLEVTSVIDCCVIDLTGRLGAPSTSMQTYQIKLRVVDQLG